MQVANFKEIWLPLVGFKGLYEVSNLGRIKSVARKVIYDGGYYTKKELILKTNTNKKGYVYINLSKNSKRKNYIFHRLIAKTFLPNPQNKPQVNHKNGIKSDNRVENLEWVTNIENQRHAWRTKLKIALKGEKHPSSKLTKKEVVGIKRLSIVRTHQEIADAYGIKRQTVGDIVNKRTWKHI